jgi:hypothetical protein
MCGDGPRLHACRQGVAEAGNVAPAGRAATAVIAVVAKVLDRGGVEAVVTCGRRDASAAQESGNRKKPFGGLMHFIVRPDCL